MENPVKTTCDTQQLTIGNNNYQDISVYSVLAETVLVGTVLCFNDTDKRYEIANSAAAKTSNLRVIVVEDVEFTAMGTVDNVRVCTGGDISEEKILFQVPTDTLDSVWTTADTMRSQAQAYGFNLIKSQDLSK